MITSIYCSADFEIDVIVSVFCENKLLNCQILKKDYCYLGQFYHIKILEYPAKKVIK